MFRLIVEKELREIIGSTKFAVTFLVSSLLVLLAFYVGARNYQVERSRYETAVQENFRQMEGLTDWLRAEHRIFLPPRPLSALVTGISNDIGRNVQVRGRDEPVAEDSLFNDDPIFAVFRFLDLDFVFQVVLSLFAILFVYNAISGEKEQGTLRLSFANPVPRAVFILAKVTGAFLGLALPLLVPVLLGCLLLPLMGVPMSGQDWLLLGFVILTGLGLLGVFLNLSVMVSALTQRSSSSFLILLTAWIFSVLIIPRTSVLLAGRAVEVASIDEAAYQKASFRAQLWEDDKNKMSAFQPKSGDVSEMMKEFRGYMQEIHDQRQEKMREFSDRFNERRSNQDQERRRLAFGLARLSPAAAFSLAAMNLTGTSVELKEDYYNQAREYQKNYDTFIRQKTGGGSGGMIIRIMSEDQKEPDPIDPREVPQFEFKPPPARVALADALPDMGMLGLFNLLFFAGAFTAFLRYDLR